VTFHALFTLRILITRVSPEQLNIVWPMLVTELMQIFNNYEKENPNVLLEAAKVVDTACVVLPDSFQIFKWMFIGDYELVDGDYDIKFKPFLEYFGKGNFTNETNHEERRILSSPKFVKDLSQVKELIQQMNSISRQEYLYSKNEYDKKYMDDKFIQEFISFTDEQLKEFYS